MKATLILLLILFSVSGHCQKLLSDGIPAPFYALQDQGKNKVMNINSGSAALQMRLDMIRRAKKHIVVEYFIYNTDIAAKIFTRELVAATKRGVKVRILIDKSKPIFEFDPYYVKALAPHGIEVRYYNAAPIIRISTVQFRNHRKILAVDDQEAITGGRNIGNDYFDLSNEFDFNDRDVYVKGPVVETMRKSFDKFFANKITETPELPEEPLCCGKKKEEYRNKTAKAEAFLIESAEEVKMRARVERIGRAYLNATKLHICPITTFATDAPGANFFKRLEPDFEDKFRFLRKALYDKISVVDKSILLSSPYMINNDNTKQLMDMLLSKRVEINIFTNSLASTDAVYVAANLYLDIMDWTKLGINVYLHDGKWLGEDEDNENLVKHAKWGTHCKTQVYETSKYSEVMIGTYNVDNRSNFYNAEMALFCRGNDEFTNEVKSNIMSRARKGIKVRADGVAVDQKGNVKDIHGTDAKGLGKMNLITLPSWMLRFLL